MIDTILIDFDGTLMNTRDGIISSWKYVFKSIYDKEVDEEFLRDTFGEPLKVSLEKMFPEIKVEDSLEIYREYQRENQGEMMKPFEGMVELIKNLKTKGYKVALVTSRGSISSKRGLLENDILDCFDYLITEDVCDKHKPHPEPIEIALEKLGSKSEEAIMIGDTMFDLLCAKSAGVKFSLVGWSFDIDIEGLEDEHMPYHIMNEAKDIFDILEDR